MDFSDPHAISAIIEHLTGEVRFDMTSVHDVSLRDAWSKVIQGVMEMLPAVEQLLLNFNAVRLLPLKRVRRLMLVDVRNGQFLPVRYHFRGSTGLGRREERCYVGASHRVPVAFPPVQGSLQVGAPSVLVRWDWSLIPTSAEFCIGKWMTSRMVTELNLSKKITTRTRMREKQNLMAGGTKRTLRYRG